MRTVNVLSFVHRFIFQLASRKYKRAHPVAGRIHDAISWTLFAMGWFFLFAGMSSIENAPAKATLFSMLKDALPIAILGFILLFSFAKYNQDEYTWEQ